MIGRSVWAQPSLAWLQGHIDDTEFRHQVGANFRQLIEGWRSSRGAQAPCAEEVAA
jgi:5-dehydro-2-deoxygluconokinase